MKRNTQNWVSAIRRIAVSMIMGTLVSLATAAPASAPTGQITASFDHLRTGFPLTGVHTSVRCETCHAGGVFKGTPKNCAGCHSVGVRAGATPKPADHVQTSAPCDYCHTNTSTFSGAKFNHTGISTGCATCHNGVTALGKSSSHIMTASSCETCHTNTVSFIGGALFNHLDGTGARIISGCATCHNGSTAKGKSASHFSPVPSTCESCHFSTISFAGAQFNHASTATIGVCGTCHLGQFASVVSKPSTHFPVTGNNCDSCHTSTASFKTATMNHTGIAAACATCHGGQYAGVVRKPAAHIATAAACNTCHTSTVVPGGFASWSMDHTGISSGCASCHGGQFTGVVSKPATHIATSAACESCHSSTVTFTAWTMNHGGISSNCASCHNGQFAGVASKPVSGHIPSPPALMSCESCHRSTVVPGGFASWSMNHTGIVGACATCHNGQFVGVKSKADFPAHMATTAGCENCHSSTVTFAGATFNHAGVAPGTCATCHNGRQALGKPAGHMATSLSCDSCHTNTANYTSFLMTTYNHVGVVVGAHSCTSGNCHSGTPNGAAKPATHITTAAACDTCHTNTVSFLGAVMSHVGIAINCASCHNNQFAGVVSKPALHIPSPPAVLTCETCHSSTVTPGGFATWSMSHTGISSGCATCHNGQYAGVASKPALHITTSAACESCHTSTVTPGGFATWSMNHSGITTNCASCHGGQFPGVKSKASFPTHLITTAACESCHTSTVSFALWSMNHAGITAGCASCHNGVTALGKPLGTHIPSPPAVLTCESCHSSTTTPGGFATWRMDHTGIAVNCITCHGNTTLYPGVVSKADFPTHMATVAGCETCHHSTTTFLGATGAHTSAPPAGTCYSCHGGGTPGGYGTGGGKAVSVGHIPTGALQCDACHKSYTSFAGTAMVHSVVAATRCDACHNGSYTTQGITLGAQAKTSISNHIPTAITGALDCSTCHTTATATWAQPPERMNHNGATTGCVVCHLTGSSYLGSMQKMKHNGASAAKDCSSASCHKPLGQTGTPYSAWN